MGISERWRSRAPLPADIGERLGRLGPLFHRRGVILAYLFGSLASEESADQAEDVDLGILVGDGDALDLWSEVVEALGTERLDLVDLRDAEPVLRFAIISEGRVIHRASDDVENEFELAVTREYRDTRHLREIQNAYLTERAVS